MPRYRPAWMRVACHRSVGEGGAAEELPHGVGRVDVAGAGQEAGATRPGVPAPFDGAEGDLDVGVAAADRLAVGVAHVERLFRHAGAAVAGDPAVDRLPHAAVADDPAALVGDGPVAGAVEVH